MITSDLNLLREKDPATWERIMDEKPFYPKGEDDFDQNGIWIIQGILQDAIRGRGWVYRIEHAYQPYAFIDRLNCTDSIGHHGDSPAEALLKAYTEAIG